MILVLAHEEAGARDHNFIGVAHLAIAIQRADEELSGGLFDRLGLGPDFVAALDLEANSGAGTPGSAQGKPPFTPRAKKALEHSLREALQLGQNWIGLGHMILGLSRAGGPQTLIDQLPADAQGIVAQWEADRRMPYEETDPRPGPRFRWRPGNPRSAKDVAEGFTRVVHAAHEQAPGPVGSQHLLLGMFKAGDTLARKVLESLGVAEDKVKEAIESIGPAGTLDDPPRPEYEVRVGDHSLRVDDPRSREMLLGILHEADLAERIQAAMDRRAKGDR